MTSIRVLAEGQDRVFPLGSTIRIGRAPDADVVLRSPAISRSHARIVSIGPRWWLTAEAGCEIQVAGQRVTTIPLDRPVTAVLGPGGEASVYVEPITIGAAQPGPAQPGAAQPPFPEPAAQVPPVPAPQAYVPQAYAPTEHVPPALVPQPPVPQARAPQPPIPQAPPPQAPPPQAPPPQPPGPRAPLPPVVVPPPQPTITGLTVMGRDRLQVLVTRMGTEQRIFPVGTQVRVGRDPRLELVSSNPLVSRECHGVVTSDAKGATYTDTSSRGTYLNGKKLHGPLRITESVVLRLGDPATGEELGITPPLTSTEIESNRERRVFRGRARTIAASVVAVAAAASLVGYFLAGSGKPAASPVAASSPLAGGIPESVLTHAEAATVRLLLGSPTSATASGSGDVLTPTGLILTNSHVAEPQAPGQAVAFGQPASTLDSNPPYLTVEVTTGPSSPVVPKYRARPVAVDGYLDLAVVQIYATSNGTPINPASLHLPYFTLGNVAGLQLDEPVTTLGFPGVAMSDSITVTSGVISTFVPDPLGHVKDPRFELETTARIAHGNSGGAAITNAGQLIGVPSLSIPGEGSDVSWRLRSVTEALPLITAAEGHRTYQSKILVPLSGQEHLDGVGVGTNGNQACGTTQSVSVASTSTVWFGVSYSGTPKGLDLALLVTAPDGSTVSGEAVGEDASTLPLWTAGTSGGECEAFGVSATDLNESALPSGTYQLQLYGGPSLAPIGQTATVTVTTH